MPQRSLSSGRSALVALATCAAALLAVVPAGAAGRTAPPRCATGGLVVWLDTTSNGAAGSFFYRLLFTNLTGRTCTLTGYPGVSAVDLRGRRIGSAALREPGTPVRTVVLAAGARAASTLRITDVGVYPASRCRATTAAGLRVFPPDQRASKVVPFPFGACSRAGTPFLHVRAVAAS